MLVLSRKKNETIVIGDEITVTVVDIRGGIVRLGIDAPTDVGIVRGELKPIQPEDKPSTAPPRLGPGGDEGRMPF
jgi:carbon storage regulator